LINIGIIIVSLIIEGLKVKKEKNLRLKVKIENFLRLKV